MGQIFVFNKLKWKPPIAAKLLTPPELEINLYYPDDHIKDMPAKQRTIFDSKFKGAFDPKFNTTSAARMKQIQDAVKWTEERVPLQKTEKEKQTVVETSNKLLKQAFDTWQAEIQKLCDECVTKAYEESVKAMNMKLIKAQIKSVAKIILIAGLILTAAGLVIAAAVVTGGALAPLVIGAIATGGAALYKAYKVYDSEWASSSNTIKQIQDDIKALEAAIKKYETASKSYAGTADKAKAFIAALQAPVSAIDKHVGQLDKYIFECQKSLKEQMGKVEEIAKTAKDNAEVKKALQPCQAAIEKAVDTLGEIRKITNEAITIKQQYNQKKIPDFGKLNSVVVFASSNSTTLSNVGTAIQHGFGALKKLGVALPG
jgi:predicted RNase H-like nuclease (RuvC/YqgF family)